jgi:hypothetical protein
MLVSCVSAVVMPFPIQISSAILVEVPKMILKAFPKLGMEHIFHRQADIIRQNLRLHFKYIQRSGFIKLKMYISFKRVTRKLIYLKKEWGSSKVSNL